MSYNEDTINAIRDILIERNETIATAESVTAGHVQAALSMAMDASMFFQGGITTYNLVQKVRHLKIDPVEGERNNCVSQEVADVMAVEVSKNFSSTYGISVTGYASIVPECEAEGLFAFFSIAYKNVVVRNGKITPGEQKPFAVQVYYTNFVLEDLLTHLKSGTGKDLSASHV